MFGVASRTEPGGGAYSYLSNIGGDFERGHTYLGPTPTPQPPRVPERPHTAYAGMNATPMDKTELKSEKPFR